MLLKHLSNNYQLWIYNWTTRSSKYLLTAAIFLKILSVFCCESIVTYDTKLWSGTLAENGSWVKVEYFIWNHCLWQLDWFLTVKKPIKWFWIVDLMQNNFLKKPFFHLSVENVTQNSSLKLKKLKIVPFSYFLKGSCTGALGLVLIF